MIIKFDENTKTYLYDDGYSFRLIGKPKHLYDHKWYDECLEYKAIDSVGDQFIVHILRQYPHQWHWDIPQID